MKRRQFIGCTGTGIAIGLSGCIGPFSGEDVEESLPPEGTINLGTGGQMQIVIPEPDYEYEVQENLFLFRGNNYLLEEFGTITASEVLRDNMEALLENEDLLIEDGISVSIDQIETNEVENQHIVGEFTPNRSDNTVVVVEYDIEIGDDDILQQPNISFSELVDTIPHSGEVDMQFDEGRFVAVLPIMARTNIN